MYLPIYLVPLFPPQDLLPPARKREPIPPQSLRVVVDTMLQGLGQHLRCCGVDVAILDNTDGDHARAAEVGHPLLLDISVRNLARVQENTENDLQGSQCSCLMYQDFLGEILKSFQKVDHSISVRPL